jgi:hypothetical protein
VNGATGDVEVTTVVTGVDVDLDGFVVRVNGEWDYDHAPTSVATMGR